MNEVLSVGTEHFGERLRRSKLGPKMTRALYGYPNRSQHQRLGREVLGEELWKSTAWTYRDEEHSQHSDAYLLVQRDAALRNFDLSMRYFDSLAVDEFQNALEHVLAAGRTFKPVQSLKDWADVPGAYVMVFDEYKQFYIGKANNIRTRIMKHWSTRKSFDRLIFPSTYESIFPVDELRALDTTRIFAARSTNAYALEERAEKAADQQFCLNRMPGGASPVSLMLSALSPRRRPHELAAIPMSYQEYDQAWDGVVEKIEQARSSHEPGLIEELTKMDMAIHLVTREDGTQFMWSRRDGIAGAAARGELSVEEFSSFLGAMGETIIWPES